jgi:hypothetical protein
VKEDRKDGNSDRMRSEDRIEATLGSWTFDPVVVIKLCFSLIVLMS